MIKIEEGSFKEAASMPLSQLTDVPLDEVKAVALGSPLAATAVKLYFADASTLENIIDYELEKLFPHLQGTVHIKLEPINSSETMLIATEVSGRILELISRVPQDALVSTRVLFFLEACRKYAENFPLVALEEAGSNLLFLLMDKRGTPVEAQDFFLNTIHPDEVVNTLGIKIRNWIAPESPLYLYKRGNHRALEELTHWCREKFQVEEVSLFDDIKGLDGVKASPGVVSSLLERTAHGKEA